MADNDVFELLRRQAAGDYADRMTESFELQALREAERILYDCSHRLYMENGIVKTHISEMDKFASRKLRGANEHIGKRIAEYFKEGA